MSLSRRRNKVRRSRQGETAMTTVADQMKTSVTISADHLHKEAYRLCCNRWSYGFLAWEEQRIVRAAQQANLLEELVRHVLINLDSDDGDVRVGAAELLGAITPLSMREEVVPALQRHLSDGYMRDYCYGGFQGDEEDMRTVCGCAEQSIRLLSEATELLPEPVQRGLKVRLGRLFQSGQSNQPATIWGRDQRIV